MANNFKNQLSGFGLDLLEEVRESQRERLDDTAFQERVLGIEKATAAMKEVGIEDKKIIQMLQKHWDLRLSEAELFINSK